MEFTFPGYRLTYTYYRKFQKLQKRREEKKRHGGILSACTISFRNSIEWKVAGFITFIVYLMDKTTKPFTPFRITLRPRPRKLV